MVDFGFQFGGIVVYWREKFETMEVRKMKFSEIGYERVDLPAYEKQTAALTERLRKAGSFEAVEEILRQQGYFALYGVVTASNTGSCAFHRAMGFRQMAEFPACGWKLGQWHGVVWFEKRLRDGDVESPPVGWRDI